VQGQIVNARKSFRCEASDLRTVGLILLWIVLYFNVHQFAVVQAVGRMVPIAIKVITFCVFLLVALYTVNGIYMGVLTQTPKRLPPLWFAVAFALSMVFAVVCSDRQLLFKVLSFSIFPFDRLLYFAKYRKAFRNKHLLG
jgi:hypothetical protein